MSHSPLPSTVQTIIVFQGPAVFALLSVAERLLALLPGKGLILHGSESILPQQLGAAWAQGNANVICLLAAPTRHLFPPQHFRSFTLNGNSLCDDQKKVTISIADKRPAQIAEEISHLLFRPNVACFLLNSVGQLLCCHRSDVANAQEGFQIPQGGIEAGEDYLTALGREIREETCLRDLQVQKELSPILRYIWPVQLTTVPYLGQAQKYFLVRIPDSALGQLGPSEEFDFFLWADINFLLDRVVPFKRSIYQQAWQLLNINQTS